MTTKPEKISVKTLNIISALLMVAMLACQFLPYWQFGEGESVSLHGYVWFPTDHKPLTDALLPLVKNYPSNQAALACVPVLALCLLSLFLCLSKSDKQQMGIFPLLTGSAGLVLYLTSPVMRAGFLCWVHVALLALMLMTGILTLTRKKHV